MPAPCPPQLHPVLVGYFSNGTDGMIFEEQWCSRCVHSDHRPGKEIGDRDNPPCPVWMAHLVFAYDLCNKTEDPGKQILEMLIEHKDDCSNECKMFSPVDAGAMIPGQLRLGDE